MLEIEYFYSAHSAFAYLGAARLMEIAANSGRQVVHKPIDLNAVISAANPKGLSGRTRAHRAYYFGREIERWAEYRDVPFKGGIPSNHGNSVTLANSMLIAADQQGHNIDRLALALMEAHWSHHADLADERVLADLAKDNGIDPQPLLQAASSAEVKSVYQASTKDAIGRSIFGSPTYFVDGDMFYGQDHIELVERALMQPFANNWSNI